MSATDRSWRFADALQAFEKGEQAELLDQFVDGAELSLDPPGPHSRGDWQGRNGGVRNADVR